MQAHPNLILQAAAAGGGSGSSTSLINPALSRGRGIDERAARAAAEARKKAVARGLSVRPNGAPVHLQPLTQLLNIINSSGTPETAGSNTNKESDASRKEVDGHTAAMAHGGGDKRDNPQPVQPPVGLGRGLASLESKKQKARTKVTS
ncbi:hypothetical protein SAY86_010257 [Trapa natans]|uniref:Uncharacterized protein n=1 Tax=Trapa natans TaxID=22666 RepID=A0AAN7QQY6_TRANT|nr:hypothetical protein SAY86_010257 [Trapa natans]